MTGRPEPPAAKDAATRKGNLAFVKFASRGQVGMLQSDKEAAFHSSLQPRHVQEEKVMK